MEAVGMISRAAPAVGLVRRSLSFSLPGKQAASAALLSLAQSSAVTSVHRDSFAGALVRMASPATMDGIVDMTLRPPDMHNPLPMPGSSLNNKQAPSLSASGSQTVKEAFSVNPGGFAWPEIGSEGAERRGQSTTDQSDLATKYWGRIATGQSTSRVAVVGHRGSGKNKSKRLPWVGGVEGLPDVRENTTRSFALAGDQGADFVEFDVQVSRDSHAVIFHDDYVRTPDQEPRRIKELTLDEFRKIGPQEKAGVSGRQLLRQVADGVVEPWNCAMEGPLCTLEEAFEKVAPAVGFNIEVKFLDSEESLEEIRRVVTAILADVKSNAGHRRIIFSTFHPDAAVLLRRLQDTYPVFFLTDGGSHLYQDPRRNSLAAAIDLCKANQLHGIVSEVTAILRQPEMIRVIKSHSLGLYTYGEENNLPEAVFFQQFQGVDGLIVDNVRPVANLVKSFSVFSAPVLKNPTPQVEQLPVVAALNEIVRNAVAIRAA